MTAPPPRQHDPVLRPVAALLAWLWPGLGHIAIGERRRGGLIMFGVLFLFVSGLLVGGVDCVDRRHDRLWFLAQGLCGPLAFGADLLNQSFVQTAPVEYHRGTAARRIFEDAGSEQHDELAQALRRVGLGHVNEMGTLFIALAGLMNLVVILDALYYLPRHHPERRLARPAT